MRASLGSIEVAAGAVLVGVVAVVVYLNRKALETAVNPLNKSNVANKASDAVSRALTGHTPGVDVYNLLHPNGARSTTYTYDATTHKIVRHTSGGSIFNPRNW